MRMNMNSSRLHLALAHPLSPASTLFKCTSSTTPFLMRTPRIHPWIMHAAPPPYCTSSHFSFSTHVCFVQLQMSVWAWGGGGGALGIRMMGGGPRTFPGGVTKWQWKRMQEKKQKLREKAWLAREKLIYDRRRRAELMAATPMLEKPWERHSRAPAVLPVDFDPKIKAMADRFQKDGALYLWNDEDGPQHLTAQIDRFLGPHPLGIGLWRTKTEESNANSPKTEQNPIMSRMQDANRHDDASAQDERSKKAGANFTKSGQSALSTKNTQKVHEIHQHAHIKWKTHKSLSSSQKSRNLKDKTLGNSKL